MDLAAGGSLRDLIYETKKNPLKESQIRFLVAEIVVGIEGMHNNYVCHRDMKPENILLTKAGNVKIGDFGEAKEFDG